MAAGGKEMELAIRIAGKVDNSYKNALNMATKGVGAVAKGIGGIAKIVGASTVAAAGAVGTIGIAAINTGREFEEAMSQVTATMLLDKSTTEGQKAFETLENAARECGASTTFSATEAAEALNYLALAGYDANKAATALPTVLKLAGAGAMELATASDMITDSMSALGIEATEDNLKQFSDQLAQTASKSNTSVAQLGEAILTVGGSAKGLSGGTAELNTALGILADNGIKASEGGTHLRNMLLSLQKARNSDAAALFKQMGLSAYDAEGNMRSLGDVFGDINNALDGASAEKVNNTLSTIFKQTDLASARAMLAATVDSVDALGTVIDASLADSGTSISALGINLQDMADNFNTAITQETFAAQMMEQFGMTSEQAGTLFNGLQSVLNGTGNRFEELTTLIENSKGACEDMYAIQNDNLNGDIKILQSSLAELGNSIYADINGPLREMTQLATSMVGEITTAYAEGGMQGMAGAVGECLSEAVNVAADYAPQIINIGVDFLSSFISGIEGNSEELVGAAEGILFAFVNGVFTLIPQVISAGTHIVLNFAVGITQALPQLLEYGVQLILNLAQGVISNLPFILQVAVQIVTNLIMGLSQMLPMLIQGGIQLIVGLLQGVIQNLPLILQAAAQIIATLIAGLIQALPAISSAGQQLLLALKDMVLNTDWEQLGKDIIWGIINGILGAGKWLGSSIKNLLTGKDTEINLSDTGAKATKSYADGIASNVPVVSNAASTLSSTAFMNIDYSGITAAGTSAGSAFNTALTGNTQTATTAATGFGAGVNMALDGEWQKTKSNAQVSMQQVTQTVTSEAQAAAQAVKGAFESMTITIPKPKIPVINVSANSVPYGDGGNVSVPQFSVNWNALGGIFEKPTVFNTSSGLQGAGEAGPEALLPLDTLWSKMQDIVSHAVSNNSGGSIVDALVTKLQGIGGGSSNSRTTPELATTQGMTIHWNPTYNLYGSAGKDEIVEANGMTQVDFDRYMKQWERENRRKMF